MIILYIFLVMFFIVALVATYENHLYSITYGRNSFLGILVIISSLVVKNYNDGWFLKVKQQ